MINQNKRPVIPAKLETDLADAKRVSIGLENGAPIGSRLNPGRNRSLWPADSPKVKEAGSI
jgi:hypothetical protein